MQYVELVPFFKDRLYELFHKDSLDSYRVRYHNTLSILKELKSLIEGWYGKNIKRAETLQLCVKEAVALVKQDKTFDFSSCSSKRFISILNQFCNELNQDGSKKDRNSSQNGTHIIYIINKYISDNQIKYLNSLWDRIESVIFDPGEFQDEEFMVIAKDLDLLTTSLAREILNRGYSKREAFKCVQSYSRKENTIEAFQSFKQKLCGSSRNNYKIVLQLYIVGANTPVFSGFLSELDPSILNESAKTKAKFINFISKSTNRRFYLVESNTTDAQSAIREAKRKLYSDLDAIQLGINKLSVKIHEEALVIEKRGGKDDRMFFQPTEFVLDWSFPQSIAISNKYKQLLQAVKNNSAIDESVKIRIDGALRHLRIANSDSEIEQRFINYWIALEFIFSSPLIEENTYLRVKNNLTNILSVCYVIRNIEYMETIMRKKHILREDEKITSSNIDALIVAQSSLLLKYRLSKFKSRLFTESERRKAYANNHRTNLESHLSRIYHLRNQLIHEAAINQDIEDLTSNLKYYLIFLLNQMIAYFSSINTSCRNSKITLDEFFYEYQIKMDDISEDWSLEKMRAVVYQKDLII